MRRTALCCLLVTLPLTAALKEKNWLAGKVVQPLPTRASADHPLIDPHIVGVQGGGSVFTIQEKSPWHGWCLLVIGDDVKYMRDGNSLYVLDSSGTECKFVLMQTGPAPAPPSAPAS
jgi:hypothetical protein